ncbi:hypothetical protein IFM89_025664 [Coptis chinensis]|uniref:J domain-containing protein n=1 Tax=Coptis chinensis TaxID=261450 RepID=A0A835LFR7_9MAGN|nr:hypothetical protein IFM89_025664 [Coptis chinensis]
MKKLNIDGLKGGDKVEESNDGSDKVNGTECFGFGSDKKETGSFSNTASTSSFDAQANKSTQRVSNDPGIGNTMHGSFSFQAAKPSRSSSVGSDHPLQPNDDSKSSEASTSSYSFHTAGVSFQSSGTAFEESTADSAVNTVDSAVNKAEFAFGAPPPQDSSRSSTEKLFTGMNQKLEFSAKKGAVKDLRTKKKKGKTREPVKIHLCNRCDWITAEESLNINEDTSNCGNPDKEKDVSAECHSDEFVSGLKGGRPRSKTETGSKTDASVAAKGTDRDLHTHVESKGDDGRIPFCFASNSQDASGTNFTFAAATTTHGHTSAAKRHYKKKNWLKVGQDSYTSTLNAKLQFASPDKPFFPLPGGSVVDMNRKGDPSISQSIGENRAESVARVAHEACEKWRLRVSIAMFDHCFHHSCLKSQSIFICIRGNQAYANGELSNAEDYYTRGLNCVPENETSESCLTALMLCYSNRAATRMSSGRTREALDDCKKAAEINPDFRKVQVRAAKIGNKITEPWSKLAVTVRELLRHKSRIGNRYKRRQQEMKHFNQEGILKQLNITHLPYHAILSHALCCNMFCNRAAAHQALGQITDAIADCSLAIALDGNYPKAISRRATLHEMIRDYGQAAIDLERLASLLERQTEEKSNQSGKLGRSTSGIIDLRQAHSRLSTMEEEARKGIPLDLYLILGIESSGMASDIKKAYRRAALRHHPDKAGQILPRSENGNDGVWKEVAEEVHKDADRLFKMIGEAYAVLSDPVKRSQYDDEEIRYTKKDNVCSTSRASDVHSYPFERNGSRKQWQEAIQPCGLFVPPKDKKHHSFQSSAKGKPIEPLQDRVREQQLKRMNLLMCLNKRKKICESELVEGDNFVITLNGEELQKPRTLVSYGIENGDLLQVVM